MDLPIPADICSKDWVAGEISFGLMVPFTRRGWKFEPKKVFPMIMIRVDENEQEAFVDLTREFSKLPDSDRKIILGRVSVTSYGPPEHRKKIAHGVANGWLAISTDSHQVAQMQKSTKGNKGPLSENPSFKKTLARTGLDAAADIVWFAKPLEIAELVMSSSPNRGVKKEENNDWLKILRQDGFKVFSGIGGQAAFATDDHEMIQRCFVCQSEEDRAAAKPGEFWDAQTKEGSWQSLLRDLEDDPNLRFELEKLVAQFDDRTNVLGLFDFTNKAALPLAPPRWAPNDASSCLILDWNKSSALKSCGSIWDAQTKEGSWQSLLRDLKDDPNLRFELEKLVAQFDDRTSVFWLRDKPGESEIEHSIFVLKIKGDTEFVMSSLLRASLGAEMIENFGYDGIFSLDDSRYFIFADSHMLVSKNKDLIKRLLEKKKANLAEAEDYMQIHAALNNLTDANKVNIRYFGRLDLSLRSNYDLFRDGEFEWLNWIAREPEANGTPNDSWVQRFDGSKLPKNFATAIGPYLGAFGWVLQTEDDGWLITGCVLKKK